MIHFVNKTIPCPASAHPQPIAGNCAVQRRQGMASAGKFHQRGPAVIGPAVIAPQDHLL